MQPSSDAVAAGKEPRRRIFIWVLSFAAGGAAFAALLYLYLLNAGSPLADALAVAVCVLLSAATVVTACTMAINLKRARAERDDAERAKLAADAERDAQLALFRVAVDNMSQGLCMFGPDRKLIMSNTRYADLYGIPREQMQPGMDLQTIFERRVAAGNVPVMGVSAYLELMRGMAERREPGETIVEQEDGRVFLLGYVPLENGGWVATHQDITDRRLAEARIAHMARHDALTNLPNRASFHERLEEGLSRVDRGESLAVLCLDLDRFKGINDTLGHHFGDLLLQEVANRLRACTREIDTVARLSGDEFAIVQVGSEQPAAATSLARRIVETIALPFDLEGHQVVVGTSVGIAIAPSDGASAERLLKGADMALYRAKGDGRGTFRFFEPEMDARMQARHALEADLRRAILNQEFALHYQSIVNLQTGRIGAFEALLRWNHPERGLVAPAKFIAVAEDTGLIVPIGEWVIRQACMDAAGWPAPVDIAINLSPAQLRSPGLVPAVATALARSGLNPGRLEFEITETVVRHDSATVLAVLTQLRALGVRISMDDFGTGYSSLSYLKRFPFDKIKIDRSFVHDIGNEEDSIAIVRAVSALGKSLGMRTTAEGVETAEQLDRVRSEGYTDVQGYFFSRPRPANEIAELLSSHPASTRAVA